MNTSPAKMGEITAKAWVVQLVAIPVTLIVTAVTVTATVFLPHRVSTSELEMVWFLAGTAVAFVLHELIHAIILKLSDNLPWKEFKLGFNWRLCVFYCHCRRSVTLRAFRRCALGPLTVLGSITVIATLAYPAIWLALLTGVHLSGCIGDVWIYALSRRFPEHFLFRDFPDKIGGEVFAPAPELSVGTTT